MVTSKKKTVFYFIVFLFPAIFLYMIFFISPLIRGVQYSFTDWNGVAPELPFNMDKNDFNNNVIQKLKDKNKIEYLMKYYTLNDSADTYNLKQWLTETNGDKITTRPIGNGEKNRLKSIFNSVGISSIKFVGLNNFIEMFQKDMRFKPRIEKRYLFKEYNDLPAEVDSSFRAHLIGHIKDKDDKDFVLAKYSYDNKNKKYTLIENLTTDEIARLKKILSRNMYEIQFTYGVIGFTLLFTILNVTFANILALLLALILDQKLKTKNTLRSIFFLPNVLSLVIVAFVWSFIFNLILPKLTGIQIWLGSPDLAPFAVIIVTVWQGCGYLMIIYLAGLQTIPQEIIEVSEIDGAGGLQRLFYITLPLLLPSATICIFYSLSSSLKAFDAIYAMTSGGPAYSTTNIVIDIYNNAFLQNRFGYATAKAILLCLIIMLITGIQLNYMKRKEVEL